MERLLKQFELVKWLKRIVEQKFRCVISGFEYSKIDLWFVIFSLRFQLICLNKIQIKSRNLARIGRYS